MLIDLPTINNPQKKMFGRAMYGAFLLKIIRPELLAHVRDAMDRTIEPAMDGDLGYECCIDLNPL